MRVDAMAPLSPLLRSPNRESGVALPRNISTRTGVCRVEAVRKTVVSPRAWIVLRSTRRGSRRRFGSLTAEWWNEGESNEDVA